MGQKIQPYGLRLGINKTWKSRWFAKGADFQNQLHEDIYVRKYIKEKLKPAGVDSVVIMRSMNKIGIKIEVARPGVVIGRGGTGIEDLKKELNKILKTKVDVEVSEVKNPDLSARIIAGRIADAIEHRVRPKIAVMKELEKIKSAGAKGAKIWISGLIGGANIARTDKAEWGTVPLATLRADIDFARVPAKTVGAGLLGVKVWIYKGEKIGIDYNN